MATLTEFRTALANLSGEDSVPSSTSRDNFINRVCEDIYSRSQWPFRRTSQTLSFNSSGVATAPTDFSPDGFYDLRVASASPDRIFHLIDENMRDNYVAGDNVVWITGNDVDGYTFNTPETDSPAPALVYFKKHATLTDSAPNSPIPNVMAVAYGSLVMLKQFNDPDIDVTPEIQMYEREINKMRGQAYRNTSMRIVGPSEAYGVAIGDIN